MPRWGCQGKPAHIIARPVAAKIVHHQERIEFGGVAEAEDAAQLDAGAFHGRRRLGDSFDGADGHGDDSLKGLFAAYLVPPPRNVQISRRDARLHSRKGHLAAGTAADDLRRRGPCRGGARQAFLDSGAPPSLAARNPATKASPAPVVSIAFAGGAGSAPALGARRRLASFRAALDDDQRIMLRENGHLRRAIVGAGQDRRFVAVGKADLRAARPGEEILRAHFAQEFRRGRIDADGNRARARDDAAHGAARRSGDEGIAGEVDEVGAGDQRVGNVLFAEPVIGAAVGQEAALARGIDQRDQAAGLALIVGGQMRLDAACAKHRGLRGVIAGADAADEGRRRRRNGRATTAWLAAEPPGRATIAARRSDPTASGPSGRTSRSIITSPMTRTLLARATGYRRDSSTATCAATHGVVLDQRHIGLEAAPVGQFDDAPQQEGRHLLLADALRLGLNHRLVDARLDRAGVERMRFGDRIGDQQAARADFLLQADHPRDIVGAVAAMVEPARRWSARKRPGIRRSDSRSPARPAIPETPASWRCRGSIWRRRRRRRPWCGRAR